MDGKGYFNGFSILLLLLLSPACSMPRALVELSGAVRVPRVAGG